MPKSCSITCQTRVDPSTHLRHLVTDITELLGHAIESIERWATTDSSAEAAVCILKTMRQKLRLKGFFHYGVFMELYIPQLEVLQWEQSFSHLRKLYAPRRYPIGTGGVLVALTGGEINRPGCNLL